jgi:hypothetical protein
LELKEFMEGSWRFLEVLGGSRRFGEVSGSLRRLSRRSGSLRGFWRLAEDFLHLSPSSLTHLLISTNKSA